MDGPGHGVQCPTAIRRVVRPAGYDPGMAIEMDADEFEVHVTAALDSVPGELLDLLDNCVIVVADDAPPEDPELLGLYEGIPLTERGVSYGGVLPDTITIFRNPTLAICDTVEDVVDEVNITVVHEIAHFFGIDDDRLHELGYA